MRFLGPIDWACGVFAIVFTVATAYNIGYQRGVNSTIPQILRVDDSKELQTLTLSPQEEKDMKELGERLEQLWEDAAKKGLVTGRPTGGGHFDIQPPKAAGL